MLTRAIAHGLEIREDGNGRTLVGLAVPYGTPTTIGAYVETMARGVFADATVDPSRVKVLAAHDHESLPIGRALSLTESDAGLTAELLVSDTAAGRDVLTLVRDGVATGLSVGFVPVEDQWSTDRTAVTRTRADLLEISVVTWPAYPDAQIEAVRHVLAEPQRRLMAARLRSGR